MVSTTGNTIVEPVIVQDIQGRPPNVQAIASRSHIPYVGEYQGDREAPFPVASTDGLLKASGKAF